LNRAAEKLSEALFRIKRKEERGMQKISVYSSKAKGKVDVKAKAISNVSAVSGWCNSGWSKSGGWIEA
jgi:hypothetical protein